MPSFELIAGSSVEEIGVNLRDMLPGFFPGKTRRRSCPCPEALEHLTQEEAQKLIDMDGVAQGRDRTASSRRASSSSTRSTRSPAARARTART